MLETEEDEVTAAVTQEMDENECWVIVENKRQEMSEREQRWD